MRSTKKLALRRELLTELTPDEFHLMVGGVEHPEGDWTSIIITFTVFCCLPITLLTCAVTVECG